MPTIWKLVIVGIGIYAALSIYVYYMQSGMIFYPDISGRKLLATPENIGLNFHNVEIVTEDNIKLHGWFIPDKNAKATVLFFHGNAGNISPV